MPTKTEQINLRDFCDLECTRYAIKAPRLVDGMACATDGRVLIRCKPDHAEPFEPIEGKFPKVSPVMADIENVNKWGSAEVQPCEICNSTGRVHSQCTECDGYGHWICPTCEHEAECCECDGQGNYTGDCECRVRYVGKVPVAARYCYLVDKLPGITWQLDADPEDPVYFRFDYGDGALMGIKAD